MTMYVTSAADIRHNPDVIRNLYAIDASVLGHVPA